MENGVLYYLWMEESFERKLLVVPRCLREEFIKFCHENLLGGGYFSSKKTKQKVKQDGFWYGLDIVCSLFIRVCPTCDRWKKPNRKRKGNLTSYQAGTVLDRVHIDLIGPISQSKSGSIWILMVVCQFSRWVESFSIENAKAETVASKLVLKFMARYGIFQDCQGVPV